MDNARNMQTSSRERDEIEGPHAQDAAFNFIWYAYYECDREKMSAFF
jgi:hypothetical protein